MDLKSALGFGIIMGSLAVIVVITIYLIKLSRWENAAEKEYEKGRTFFLLFVGFAGCGIYFLDEKIETLALSAYLGELIGTILAQFFIASIIVAFLSKYFFPDNNTPKAKMWKSIRWIPYITFVTFWIGGKFYNLLFVL